MLSKMEYVRVSIEVNLFFQRIMKEHLFFIETNLQPVETVYIVEASRLKRNFERLLSETVHYANGVISENVINSHEIVTPYTLKAEQLNSMLTGANLNTEITKKQYELVSNSNFDCKDSLENAVNNINRRSYDLLEEVIAFQKKLLSMSLECRIFITLYEEMLEHDTREAIYYRDILKSLIQKDLSKKALCDELNFWNNIMAEHAQFVDGMLDPTEKTLKATAQTTARGFEKLVQECIKTAENQILQRSLVSTQGIRDFKRAATEGLLKCKIKSIIPCLLADHVLREANHYLRLLTMMKR